MNRRHPYWRQTNLIFRIAALALLIAGVGLDTGWAQGEDGLVSLSASSIIGMLRNEPGLLLEAKKALVKVAASEGRLLDAQDLTDNALYSLIREDAGVRALVTREIEERRYVQAKPRRQELENGMVFASKRTDKEAVKPGENAPRISQEEVYWASHERALEHFPEPVETDITAGVQPGVTEPFPQTPASSSQPAYSAPRSVPAPERQLDDPRRQIESATGEVQDGEFSASAVGAATQMLRIRPEELPGLVNASLMDKPPLDIGRLGSGRAADRTEVDPLTSRMASALSSPNESSSPLGQAPSEQLQNNRNAGRNAVGCLPGAAAAKSSRKISRSNTGRILMRTCRRFMTFMCSTPDGGPRSSALALRSFAMARETPMSCPWICPSVRNMFWARATG